MDSGVFWARKFCADGDDPPQRREERVLGIGSIKTAHRIFDPDGANAAIIENYFAFAPRSDLIVSKG